MDHPIHTNVDPRQLKTFILEDREWYRLLLRHWLEDKNGHQVRFFDSSIAMEENGEPRDLELMAIHLLSGGFRFKKEPNGRGQAVYGEALDPTTVLWCRKSGVQGILDLQDGPDHWKECVEKVKNGEASETPSARHILHHGRGKGLAKLSRREAEVARMLVKGFSAKQVASDLAPPKARSKISEKPFIGSWGSCVPRSWPGPWGLGKSARSA